METFAQPRQFVDNPRFDGDRKIAVESLALEGIDAPIRELVAGFARLPCCFTLQSCHGHFVHAEQRDPHSLEPVPAHDVGSVEYRIAYIALCLENSSSGRSLREGLEQMPAIDPEYVQFGSPEWFWHRHPNTYALQVEPTRWVDRDVAMIDHHEALHIQQVRSCFFARLTAGLPTCRTPDMALCYAACRRMSAAKVVTGFSAGGTRIDRVEQ